MGLRIFVFLVFFFLKKKKQKPDLVAVVSITRVMQIIAL